ncbi:hypothetical protein DSL92_07840 [Billgrantia gudaonensis]|uniref:Uncharacterized protein n=1 Tax=Billgrantia gudaonensis TaxID=376427 RepID=A0A3S0R4K6_9GAMM|nr:hypothetical protein DSL92_07840 [Halomonas gudaonensis]
MITVLPSAVEANAFATSVLRIHPRARRPNFKRRTGSPHASIGSPTAPACPTACVSWRNCLSAPGSGAGPVPTRAAAADIRRFKEIDLHLPPGGDQLLATLAGRL